MHNFKELTEQLLKIYSNSKSVDDLGIENYFDENISIIGTGEHEFYQILHQSVPDQEQMDGEEFPLSLGKQAKENRQALLALGTAYYDISSLNLKTERIELVKRSRASAMDVEEDSGDWYPQFEIIKEVIAEPFVQKYMDFFDIRTMAARLRNKESMSDEFMKKDGTWFLSMVVPQTYDADGNITTVLFANRDVTDEKIRELRQERELREAKLKAESAKHAKSSFLFNMSHDIRTPMNAIIGYADLASRHVNDTEKLGRYLEKIHVCGEELLSLLNSVLNLARIENNRTEMEYTVSNVCENFENCVTMFQQQAESKNQTLSMTEQILYPYVYMDAPHVSEICLNIISNAIKYTNAGGTISCHIAQTSSEKEDWCNLTISVTDNGIGMSEEFQKHLFEAFERESNTTLSHIDGSGIGMDITKKLVDLMDGTIEVKSKQGEGSTFTVTIPCRKASEEDFLVKKNNTLRDKNCLSGVRILLVEDNEINREIATELLAEEGCVVEIAGDGVACIDMVEKAEAGYYKLILMDIQMPVMNGYDATFAIRKLRDTEKAGIPIIAMTANAFAEDVNKALSVGMNDHVAKPIDMNVLVPTMMKYL